MTRSFYLGAAVKLGSNLGAKLNREREECEG